jgi:hypothetical protein
LLASEESDERPAALPTMVTDRPTQHGITRLKSIQNPARRDRLRDGQFHLALDSRQGSQMCGKNDSDHGIFPVLWLELGDSADCFAGHALLQRLIGMLLQHLGMTGFNFRSVS